LATGARLRAIKIRAIKNINKSKGSKMPETITEQELRDMPLHDTKELTRHIKIVKVVGGWIYWNEVPRLNAVAGVFVPCKESQQSKP
ncbi:unnamed protein product, partial [marine sediment metagenome]